MKHLLTVLVVTACFCSFRSPMDERTTPEELLSSMVGEWKIEARMRMAPDGEFRKMSGTAKFENHFSNEQVKETFTLGGRFKGEAFINYAAGHKRYELFQIDQMSSRRSTINLLGEYIEDKKRLNFKEIPNHSQWGQSPSLEIRWEYIFYEDGSFKKEMYSKDSNGDYYLQSDYHYKSV